MYITVKTTYTYVQSEPRNVYLLKTNQSFSIYFRRKRAACSARAPHSSQKRSSEHAALGFSAGLPRGSTAKGQASNLFRQLIPTTTF